LRRIADINSFEPALLKLSDEELKAKTSEFRGRLQQGQKLDDLLPEAFAVVREASRRVFNMRHFDVQLVCHLLSNVSNKFAHIPSTAKGRLPL